MSQSYLPALCQAAETFLTLTMAFKQTLQPSLLEIPKKELYGVQDLHINSCDAMS